MSFIYDDGARGAGPKIDVWKMDGSAAYLRHYANKLYLTFIANNPRSTLQEKFQAEKELKICERKLTFWNRHPNYVQETVTRGIAKLKKDWSAA